MTKRLMAMLTMLVCVVGLMRAQSIASEATSTADLTDGYYVIKVKSNDGKTADDGNYMYFNSSDNKAYYEQKDATTDLLGTDITSSEDMKYVFYVTKTSGKLTIKAWSSDVYFPSISEASSGNQHPANQEQFTMNSSSSNFEPIVVTDNWVYLKVPATYRTWALGSNKSVDAYITVNSNQYLGYWENSSNATNNAQFKFYATTDVPNANDVVSISYNIKFNDVVKSTATFAFALKGKSFPKPTNLPAFVNVSDFPTRNVTAEDNNQTFDLNCVVTLPFQTSTAEAPIYYYMENATDAPTRLYANGSNMSYRESAQASALNDVRGDLWYVTGNPFDGLEFHNVGANKAVQSNMIPSNRDLAGNRCKLAFSGTGGESVWYPIKVDDNTFGLYRYSDWTIGRGNVAWTFDASAGYVKFEKIDLNASLPDATYHFQMTPATISLPLNYSAADDARFATTCLPYAVEVADGASTVKAYAGQLVNGNTELDMAEVSAVPANQGVIIKGDAEDESVVLRVIGSAADIANDLRGTTSELTDLTGVLSFGRANGNGKVGFFRSTNATLKANRAYVKLDGENQANLAMRFDGTTTSIDQINGAETVDDNAPIYDLTGRQVSHLVKGSLYIQGGRKFIAQ